MAKQAGGRLLKLTGYKGVQDRLLLMPYGIAVFVEFKRPKKDPRKIQSWWQEQVNELGFEAVTIDSTAKFKVLLYRSGYRMPIKSERRSTS